MSKLGQYFKTKAAGFLTRLYWISSGGDPLGLAGAGGGSEAGESVTERRLLGLSTAWACINLYAGLMATLPIGVYRRLPDGSRASADDHWLSHLLKKSPNADQTAVDFWEFVQVSLELRGSAFARKRFIGKRLVAIEPIAPDLVMVRRLEDGSLEYEIMRPKGARIKLGEDEVWHIRGFGGDPLGGLSTLSFGANVFGMAIASDKSAGSFFKNGMQSPGAFKFSEWLKPDQRAVTETSMAKKYQGASKAGIPMVLEGGVDWVSFSFNPKEAQLLESRSYSVEEICRFFQVPPVLVGHTDKVSSWGTGIQEISIGFVKYALARRVKRIEQSIDKSLLTAADRAAGIYVEFNMEGLLRGSPKERAEFYRTMTQIASMTVNEVRKLENLPPVPGGDVPRLQSQNIPLGIAVGSDPVSPVLLNGPGE